ncbi:GNAT family N-acetyltransferase [Aquimarina mytili]|uniref:GNAT family N-acetyltransferase n=1 Tax=Aquimarina mytili TaxID=874423 RepID=A0A936ZQN6_9FLAO|nr:GNAT family N-acetyltransferase [Aquimarina mytili]MBL0683894.1 GNAT family N-acetyltransferase [Aquimarina mytili]
MRIEILYKTDITSTIQDQVSELFKQLSPNKKQLKLVEILTQENPITIVYCIEQDKIVGIASMCTYKVISGNKGWVEDVVVDLNFREKGIGRKLVAKLLEVGKEKGLSEILLFTEDERKSAINLYKGLEFKQKNSRIYMKISNPY